MVVPLQIFVGEKTVTKDRRRLDLSRITRLVFSVTDSGCPGSSACGVLLDNVRLESDPPYQNLFPELLRLDFGEPNSPTQSGFTPVSEGDFFRARVSGAVG